MRVQNQPYSRHAGAGASQPGRLALGGLAAVREPGSTVIAEANFPAELARSRRYHPPFQDFFGTEANPLDVKPDRLISTPETLRVAGIELALIPGKSGETDDALYVRDLRHDILFVGDAFMPYSGAPFVPEGSAEGYLDAIDPDAACGYATIPTQREPGSIMIVYDASCSMDECPDGSTSNCEQCSSGPLSSEGAWGCPLSQEVIEGFPPALGSETFEGNDALFYTLCEQLTGDK